MNPTDGFLGKLRMTQAERKESRLIRSMGFLRRNAKRFLVAGLFALVLSWLALVPGIGYTATVDITSSKISVQGHPCYGYVFQGIINTTFNPVLYPVNHLFGSRISSGFALVSLSGESAKESIIMQALLSEFPINIPFLFAVSLILAVVLEGAIRKVLQKQ